MLLPTTSSLGIDNDETSDDSDVDDNFPRETSTSKSMWVFAAVTGAVLRSGASQSRQHSKNESDSYYLSDYVSIQILTKSISMYVISLIHKESCKSPTKILFDVAQEDSILHCNTLSITQISRARSQG
ncbi:hypothetical protein Tco_0726883 [Tanacetum coccineum]|uniref:Uncharacterized protein n=1 Tax=Tanacetum coccineum TaxID=301880 RepID=A0ABQ4YJ68_9ASTR